MCRANTYRYDWPVSTKENNDIQLSVRWTMYLPKTFHWIQMQRGTGWIVEKYNLTTEEILDCARWDRSRPRHGHSDHRTCVRRRSIRVAPRFGSLRSFDSTDRASALPVQWSEVSGPIHRNNERALAELVCPLLPQQMTPRRSRPKDCVTSASILLETANCNVKNKWRSYAVGRTSI